MATRVFISAEVAGAPFYLYSRGSSHKWLHPSFQIAKRESGNDIVLFVAVLSAKEFIDSGNLVVKMCGEGRYSWRYRSP
jgi:hypothetical protein